MKAISIALLVIFCAEFPVFCQQQPNILWITIEDTSPEFIGAYGNKNAKTPVIDSLSTEGHRFLNAFSTGSVCSPSRTALITAVKTYETGTGHHRSKIPLPDFIKGFPYYLRKNGYFTVNNRKTDYNIANGVGFIRETWDESSASADWKNRKPGQPFFAVYNFEDSHQSRTMTFPYEQYRKQVWDELQEKERIKDSGIEVPPFYRDSPAMRKQVARVYNSLSLTDRKIGQLLAKLEDEGLRDSTIIFFFSDHGQGIPRGKTNSIDLSYRVPMAVWFPPMYRHLSPWGKPGSTVSELVDFQDFGPTILSLAEAKIPDHMKGRAFAGNKRKAPPQYLFLSADRSDNGIDLARSVTDGRFIYTRNFMPFMPELRYIRYMEIGEIKQEMRNDVRSGRLNKNQAALFAPRPPEMLFDLQTDPWEMDNLAEKPAWRDVIRKFREAQKDEILKKRDILFLPEYSLRFIPPENSPYTFRLDEEKYNIESIWQVAGLSGLTDRKTLKKQIRFLASADFSQRYWALIGLCSYPKGAINRYKQEISSAAEDSYLPAAVMASWLLFHHWSDASAQENLKKFCLSDNPDIALLALNMLLYTDRKEPFVSTVREVYKQTERYPDPYTIKAACLDYLGSLGLVPNTFKHAE